MAFVSDGSISPLGWTDDNSSVALQFKSRAGDKLVIEFPVEHLPEASLIATQMATKSAERTKTAFEPPRLPVAKWSAGASPETGDIVLKFEYPVAGSHSFRIDRATALALHSGLGELLAKRIGGN